MRRASQATVTDPSLNQAFREGTGIDLQWKVWIRPEGEEWRVHGTAYGTDGVVYLVREVMDHMPMTVEIQITPVVPGSADDGDEEDPDVIEAEVVDDDV